ncbi:SH3 domain-containing kinase-binding protein 1 isoform X6 [Cyclopterus lumpus]|uniref:SH3 domain-containing kinase-binding protein 1 isoform X6 n=1 Tax=Cyclopterus lumpus TaxID=8103 RepID=UPI0014862565|nr:SH3 domain-containing kinase-binding protein 1 isoform X6 [Cyclopterus lumpus]
MVEAVVEFDYEAQQDDELGLAVGDVIVNIRRDDGGWWEGELGGRRGLFPDNFVREIKKEGKRDGGQASMIRSDLSNGRSSPVSDASVRSSRKVEQIRKRRCKAAFSYAPQHEDELELKIGDVVEIISEVEEGWWEGFLNGKTGMFPSNFTKVVQTESETSSLDTSQEELRSNRTSKDSPGSESDGGDSRSETGSGEIQPKKVRGFGFGDIFKDQPIRLRPRSMEVDSEGDKVNEGKAASVATETMKTEPDGKAKGRELCKVLFPYEAQNEDELSLKEGEIINIITKECADAGWWKGEVGGRRGVFPDNFVKLLDADKERPKKPPPPGAPSAKHTADVDLDVVVASTEKLNHPTASRPRVTDRRPRSQIISASSPSSLDLDSPVVMDRKEKAEPESVPQRPVEVSLRKGVPSVPDSKAPPPAKPSVLAPPSAGHRPTSPSSSSGLSPSPELRHSPLTPPTLEELRNQLRDLRSSVELLKNQHRQEMKHLTNALDDERKIRVSLQMEVEHIKKSLSK